MIHRKTLVLESLFNKVPGLQLSKFIKERLQLRCSPVNIAKFSRAPILKNICERLLLFIVIFSQENNHMQHCFDLPEPKLHRERACVMLVHSPQTTFHRKIIYSFVWICLGRSSRPEVFCKKGTLRNIAKLTRKHLFLQNTSGCCFCLGQHCIRKLPVKCSPMAQARLWRR